MFHFGHAVILHPRFVDVPVHLEETNTAPVVTQRIKITFALDNEKRILFKTVGPFIANNLFNFAARVGSRWLILRRRHSCMHSCRRGRSCRRDAHAGAFGQANFLTNQQHRLCRHAIDGCHLRDGRVGFVSDSTPRITNDNCVVRRARSLMCWDDESGGGGSQRRDFGPRRQANLLTDH